MAPHSNIKDSLQQSVLMEDWNVIQEMLARSPTNLVARHVIKWTNIDGSKSSVCSDYHFYTRDARKEALRMAIRSGWTYPRWWQWWRWDDSRPDLDFSNPPDHPSNKHNDG